MGFLLRKKLEAFNIIDKKEDLEFNENDYSEIFSPENSKKFSFEMIDRLNECYADLALKLKIVERKIAESVKID